MIKNILAKGFTLTELMAVVIILAILTGVGAGSYKKAVERSRFTDGLVAGTTLAEAVSRYYYDNPDLTLGQRLDPKPEYLDVSLSNAKKCTVYSDPDACVKTKYFEYIIQSGVVRAARVHNGQIPYYLSIYSEVLNSLFPSYQRETQCSANTDAGYDLCRTMGYTSCKGTGLRICTKP